MDSFGKTKESILKPCTDFFLSNRCISEDLEEYSDLNADKELDLDDVAKELRQITRYVDQLEIKLNLKIEPCPKPGPCGEDIGLEGSKYPEIFKMQLDSQKLQVQFKDLMRSENASQISLTTLDTMLVRQNAALCEVRKEFNTLLSLKLQRDREFGLCTQRYKQMRKTFCEWKLQDQFNSKMQKLFEGSLERLVSTKKYRREKLSLMQEADLACSAYMKAMQRIVQRAKEAEQRLNLFGDERPMWHQPAPRCTTPSRQKVADQRRKERVPTNRSLIASRK